MPTTIRPEISVKSKYWIEKHRYYELKHFCLQYPIWKKAYTGLDGLSKTPEDLKIFVKTGNVSDPTAKCAEMKLYYRDRMDMVEQVAKETDLGLWDYIFKGVTEGLSYDLLRVKSDIPCCKDVYYNLYRRFFWILNKVRG